MFNSTFEQSLAVNSIIYLVLVLASVAVSWWALQQFRFDLFVKNPRSAQAKVLQVILSIVLGYQLALFFMDYVNWSTLLRGFF